MVLILVLLGVVAVVVTLYNRFVRLRNGADAAWSDIDVQLKRRWELVPNLVETVKGYATHEREVFEAVTQARAQAIQAQGQGPAQAGQAESVLNGALGRLFAVAENYPQLRASENFKRLQDELTDTEDKIAAARRYYNTTVRRFNSLIQSVPTNIVARLGSFREREFFRIEDDADRAPVAVNLS